MLSHRSNEDILRYKQKIGCLIQIPNIGRGQLKFVGSVDNKPGYYAGVDLLAPIGKNNGTFNGRRYFNTEYPKSGLFIQLPKVAHIIDQAASMPSSLGSSSTSSPSQHIQSSVLKKQRGSRRSTLGGDPMMDRRITNGSGNNSEMLSMGQNSGGSMGHVVRTPTPTRNISSSQQRIGSLPRNDVDMDTEMGGTTPDRRISKDNSNDDDNNNNNIHLIKEYELKLEKQNRKLLEYERLLNDQRMVLEEIQPTIDEYDKRVNDLELEKNLLKEKLNEGQIEFDKQLKYFETENKQLTDVVSQLHEDLRSNEEYMKEKLSSKGKENQNVDGISVGELQRQIDSLNQYKQEMETAKLKWNKERDQLKMHNESLSKEYQFLNKEYMQSLSNGNINGSRENEEDALLKENEALKNEIQTLKDEINEMKTREMESHQSIPPYKPPTKIDASAGRELWCSLCEKSGHDQIDCPFQYEAANRPHNISPTTTTTANKDAMDTDQYY